MPEMCKVVRGSTACGFRDVTGPLPYPECVQYLREHVEEIASPDDDEEIGLDIIYVESGRLASWVL